MAVIDPRTYRPSAQVGNTGVTTHASALNGPPPAASKVDYGAMLAADKSAVSRGVAVGTPKDVGGWKGFVADVLGNDVVKTVLKPLSLLAIPSRIIASGAQELVVDPLANMFAPGGDHHTSFSDFTSQVKDETFGYGKVLASVGGTGNKWADRIIGGAGDIILDPLMHLGLAGKAGEVVDATGKVIRTAAEAGQHAGGLTGRLNLARVVLETTGDSKLAALAAKEGRSALSAEEAARSGLGRSGFVFFGKRSAGFRVPGSGPLAELSQKGLTKVRLAASHAHLGEALQRAFTATDMRAARIMLARGTVPEGELANFLMVATSRDFERQAANRAGVTSNVRVTNLLKTEGDAAVASFKDTVHAVMEGTRPAASEAEAKHAQAWLDHFNLLGKDVNVGYAAIDPTDGAGIAMRQNYFPHLQTDEAVQWARAGKSAEARNIRELFAEPLDSAAVFKARQLEVGDTFFGHKLVAEDMNLGALNDLATAGGFPHKFFETDVVKVAGAYGNQYGKQMGVVARLAELNAKGVFQALEAKSATKTIIDKTAVADAQKAAKSMAGKLDDAALHMRTSLVEGVDHVVATHTAVDAQIATVVGDALNATDNAAAKAASLQVAHSAVVDTVDKITLFSEELGNMFGVVGGQVGPAVENVPDVVAGMKAHLAQLVAEAEALKPLVDGYGAEVAVAAAPEKGLVAAAKRLAKKAAAVLDAQREAIVLNEPLSIHAENLARGEAPVASTVGRAAEAEASASASVGRRLSKAEREVQASLVSGEVSTAARGLKMAEISQISGGRRAYITSEMKVNGELMSVTTRGRQGAFTGDALKQMSEADVRAAPGLLLSNPVANDIAGRQAGVFTILRDMKLFAGVMPPELGLAHENLLGALAGANASLTDEELQATVQRLFSVEAAAVGKDSSLIKSEALFAKAQAKSYGADRGAQSELTAANREAVVGEVEKFYRTLERTRLAQRELQGLAADAPISDETRIMLRNVLGDVTPADVHGAADPQEAAAWIDELMQVGDGEQLVGHTSAGSAVGENYKGKAGSAEAAAVQAGLQKDGKPIKAALTTDSQGLFNMVTTSVPHRLETNGEVRSALEKIRSTLVGHEWTKENAGFSYKVADGRPLKAYGGKSRARVILERGNRLSTAKAAAEAMPRRAEANIVLAEHLTTAWVMSETQHRFLMSAKHLLATSGSIPTEQLLQTISRSVAREQLAVWQSHIAALVMKGTVEGETFDAAKRMVSNLSSLANEGPSVDLVSSFMHSTATQIEGAGVGGVAEQFGAHTAGTQAQLEKVANVLRDLTSNPEHSIFVDKAMSDQKTVQVLQDMAGIDGWKARVADGTKGFQMPNGDIARMADGTPIIFSEAEWKSLYTPLDAPFTSTAGATYRAADIPKLLDAELAGLALKEQDRAVITEALAASKEAAIRNRPWPLEKEAAVKGRGKLIDRGIAEQQTRINELRAQAETLDPMTRAAGQDKMKGLAQGHTNQDAWHVDGIDLGANATADPAVAVARRQAITDAFDATPEGATIAKINDLSAQVSELGQKEFFATPGAAEAAAGSVRDAAPKVPKAAVKAPKASKAEVLAKTLDAPVEASAGVVAGGDLNVGVRAAGRSEQVVLRKQIDLLDKAITTAWVGNTTRDTAKSMRTELEKLHGSIPRRAATLVKAQAAFDAAAAVEVSATHVADTLLPELQSASQRYADMMGSLADASRTSEMLDNLVARSEARISDVGKAAAGGKQATARTAKAAGKVSQNDLAIMEDFQNQMLDLHRANLDPTNPADRALLNVLSTGADATRHYIDTAKLALSDDAALAAAKRGLESTTISQTVSKGFASLEALHLPGLQTSQATADLLLNMKRIEQPQFAQVLNDFLGRYTKFFKAYATLSPGFHVRNGMSNMFALVGAGAEATNLRAGLSLYKSFADAIHSGVEHEAWLLSVPEAQRGFADIALRTYEAAGGGRVEEAFFEYVNKGQKLSDNFLTRGSQKAGHHVEGSARFMLGYDSAVKGMDFQSATTRVKRYLFDYVDVGIADQAVRTIVPFWIWMTRNLPMTLVNQWTNPRAYALYGDITRNLATADEAGSLTPSWLPESGGFKVAGNWWLAPDFGFNRVPQLLGDFGDPKRLLAQVNPALRLPVELLGDRKLYNNAPLGGKYEKPTGSVLSPAVGALAALLGQAKTGASGDTVVKDKFNYMLTNLLPPLNQAERMMPNTDAAKQKNLSSILGFLGIPAKEVTPAMRQGEQSRLNREAAAQKADAARLRKV